MTHFKTSTSSPVESIGSKILRMIVSAGREIRERERERRLSSVRGSSFEGAPSRIFFCIFSSTSKERRKKYARKNTPPPKKKCLDRGTLFFPFFPKEHTLDRRFRTRARARRSSGTFSFSFTSSSRFPTHPRKLVVDLFFFFFFFFPPSNGVQKMRARKNARAREEEEEEEEEESRTVAKPCTRTSRTRSLPRTRTSSMVRPHS